MDWQLTCRVCLESGDMVSLFDWDENDQQLSDKYAYCCGVEVPQDDPLPTLICVNCVDKLTAAYIFKQQCLTANEALHECLLEFQNNVTLTTNLEPKTDSQLITVKQENGLMFQYELPVENSDEQWTRTLVKTPNSSVVTKAPGPKKRGRPRKYPNEQGQIDVSPYQRKQSLETELEQEAITTMLAKGTLELKQEPMDDEDNFPGEDIKDVDPDFDPIAEIENEQVKILPKPPSPKKRGRPRKKPESVVKDGENDDILLSESLLAMTEPISESLLKPKKKNTQPKKKYVYEKMHSCETCGSSFASNASLQAHVRRHLGIKPFVCSVCGYACVLSMELRRHMMRHTGVRPYKCRVCDRKFGDFGSRQKHERLHMGIRPYQCSLCGKSFTYSYVLANHMLTHTGEKKFSCDQCNKRFTKAHHLKYHNKIHHKELYQQQQMELEAKRARQQMNMSGLSCVLTGQIVDGRLQLLSSEGVDAEGMMAVMKQQDDEDDIDGDFKETDRAVAGMQAVVLDADFSLDKC